MALSTCQANATALQKRIATLEKQLADCQMDTTNLESDIGFEKSAWLHKWLAEADDSIAKKDWARMRELRTAFFTWCVAFMSDTIEMGLYTPRLIVALIPGFIV
jgi:multidrug resistance efflux pump